MRKVNLSYKRFFLIAFSAMLLSILVHSCVKEPQQFNEHQTVELRQEFSNDFSRWTFRDDSLNGSIRTEFTNSWDRWLIEWGGINGAIRTEFSNSWDRWNFYVNGSIISIRTEFSDSWNRWRITGNHLDATMYVKTQFSDDNTRWTVSSSEKGQIAELKTVFSNDYNRWDLRINLDQEALTHEEIMVVVFIGVFTSSVYEQEVF